MASNQATNVGVRVGDWVEVRGLPGHPNRQGQIVQLLGRGEHRHYLVRWDEKHESILYPADGEVIIRRRRRASHAAR